MAKITMSRELVLMLLESEDDFPVDLDDAYPWIGYPKKQDAKELLLNNFVEGQDFLRKGVKTPSVGRPSEWIVLTIDCFKSLAMMAGTGKGREVRQYFLGVEAELKIRSDSRCISTFINMFAGRLLQCCDRLSGQRRLRPTSRHLGPNRT